MTFRFIAALVFVFVALVMGEHVETFEHHPNDRRAVAARN